MFSSADFRRSHLVFFCRVDCITVSYAVCVSILGENVSTTEVEAVLMQQFNNADVVVYGVSVSGQEGTAGMAAVAVAPDQQHLTTDPACLQRLYSQLRAALPPYALPIFLRVISTDHAYKTGR